MYYGEYAMLSKKVQYSINIVVGEFHKGKNKRIGVVGADCEVRGTVGSSNNGG